MKILGEHVTQRGSLVDDMKIRFDFSHDQAVSSEQGTLCKTFNEIKTIPSNYSIPLTIDFEGSQKVKYSVLNDRKVNSISPNIFLQVFLFLVLTSRTCFVFIDFQSFNIHKDKEYLSSISYLLKLYIYQHLWSQTK